MFKAYAEPKSDNGKGPTPANPGNPRKNTPAPKGRNPRNEALKERAQNERARANNTANAR